MALITQYIDVDQLGEIIIHHPKFSGFTDVEELEGMVLKVAKDQAADYYKFFRDGDGEWSAYQIDDDGIQVGEPFALMGYIEEQEPQQIRHR